MNVLFPQVKVRLTEKDGNTFAVLGRVRKAMLDAGIGPEEMAAFTREAMSRDFNHLLVTVLRTVTVVRD